MQLPPNVQAYFSTSTDADGAPLSGAAAYDVRFPTPPPAVYLWSLTIYDATTGKLVLPNALNRTSIAPTTPGLEHGPDGSLTLTVSAAPPEAGGPPPSNWLPAPPGPFVLALRLIGPAAADVATGGYHPPPVVRLPGASGGGDGGNGAL
ncbi:hypothetical protein Rsub_03260 [Raphidocelis subcapitata]|uniref:DUF1214 domain-containing protein n=1 Tax=Raphidocelis subcapitata TaxID=307507 RepID=A0A2V0NYX6_9CHLO|nr:hypothetical protein Rsub_03260 [Raphidocelis subcapitata]|eukprot:GBF90127.1 hypothetical protein Rsub_03260 [Raphidocelis subcapitata]